jgi:hypothetical protein
VLRPEQIAPDHDGRVRRPTDRFFDPPDDRIGTLLSASTSLGKRKRSREELLLRIVFGGVAAFLVAVLFGQGAESWDDLPRVAWPLMAIAAAVVFWLFGPEPRCTYVGDRGVWITERRYHVLPRRQSFRFDDAVDVRQLGARVDWLDDRGEPVFTLPDGAFARAAVAAFRVHTSSHR